MDKQTVEYYDKHATKIGIFYEALKPKLIYKLVNKTFKPKGKVLDVGCGMGRDTNWLSNQGFNVVGVDASTGMLNQAGNRYPNLTFIQDTLPELIKFKINLYDGILCSAVLMHLPEESITKALSTMFNLLTKTGVLICSYRHSCNLNNREDGKLYTPIQLQNLQNDITQQNMTILAVKKNIEPERKHLWFTVVVKK